MKIAVHVKIEISQCRKRHKPFFIAEGRVHLESVVVVVEEISRICGLGVQARGSDKKTGAYHYFLKIRIHVLLILKRL